MGVSSKGAIVALGGLIFIPPFPACNPKVIKVAIWRGVAYYGGSAKGRKRRVVVSNRQLEVLIDQRSNAVAAEALGISIEDVENYVTFEPNESDDGELYSYIAVFDESTPLEVRQAAGLGDGFSIDLGPNAFAVEE